MNFRLPVATRNELAQAFQVLLDSGTGPGYLEIRTGPQPATADDAPTGIILGTLTFSALSAPPAVGGTLTFSPIGEDAEADNTGAAAWARAYNGDGDKVFDCDVGESGSGATIELNTVNVVAGGPIRITSFTITIPGG